MTCPTCNGSGVVATSVWNAKAAARPGYRRIAGACPDCGGSGEIVDIELPPDPTGYDCPERYEGGDR